MHTLRPTKCSSFVNRLDYPLGSSVHTVCPVFDYDYDTFEYKTAWMQQGVLAVTFKPLGQFSNYGLCIFFGPDQTEGIKFGPPDRIFTQS